MSERHMDMIPLRSLSELRPGDIIQGRFSGDGYVVLANYGTHVTAVKTVDVTNLDEWFVMRDVQPYEGRS